mmetsp:Transcript_26014/g.19587  ORF Transcript_26014/g.19587 Transcript_26014/m.19587 type:complete len:210 (-) Transcript_26014:761-1390(-)
MPAGSSSASSTVSSLTVKCLPIRPSVEEMMPSTLSSLKPVPESTCQDASSSTWNLLSLMRSGLEPTDNCSTLSSSSPERKMPPTTSPEVTTPLERKSLISAWTESESSLISAQDSRASLSSTPSVEVPDPVLDLSSSRDSPSITERSQSWASLCTHHLRCPPLWLSHTTLCSPPTLSSNTLMLQSCSITKPSTISAEETSILRDPPTPT